MGHRRVEFSIAELQFVVFRFAFEVHVPPTPNKITLFVVVSYVGEDSEDTSKTHINVAVPCKTHLKFALLLWVSASACLAASDNLSGAAVCVFV